MSPRDGAYIDNSALYRCRLTLLRKVRTSVCSEMYCFDSKNCNYYKNVKVTINNIFNKLYVVYATTV